MSADAAAPRSWTRRGTAYAVLVAAVSAILYLTAGASSAFLAADDFQWLLGAETFEWSALTPAGRQHFYRPTTMLWFAGTNTVCGIEAGCYHVFSVALHAVNVLLVFVVVRILSERDGIASAAALCFGVNPAFVQAVAWVSAATGLLAATGMLAATLFQMASWRRTSGRPWSQAGAVIAFALAVFAHEAAAVWPVLSFAVHRLRGPKTARAWWPMGAGIAAVLAVFAVTTVTANRDNYVFRDGIYAAGAHMFRNALDYLVPLWVGPHEGWAYVLTVLLLAAFLTTPLSRFGLVWILTTLVPYLGFTWANAGRYTYLPAIGFGIAVSGLLLWAGQPGAGRRVRTAAWIVAGLIIVRSGAFTLRGARGDFLAFEPARAYFAALDRARIVPADGVIRVPAPTDPRIEPQYVAVMVQWRFRDPALRVIVD